VAHAALLLYCITVYQVSHVSTECDYPLGEKREDVIPDEWAVSQVTTSTCIHMHICMYVCVLYVLESQYTMDLHWNATQYTVQV
jgi:hypothetical protein